MGSKNKSESVRYYKCDMDFYTIVLRLTARDKKTQTLDSYMFNDDFFMNKTEIINIEYTSDYLEHSNKLPKEDGEKCFKEVETLFNQYTEEKRDIERKYNIKIKNIYKNL